jgi:hypothetical protein
MRTRVPFAGRFDIPFLVALFPLLFAASLSPAGAACPPGVSYPITSGSPADGPPVVLTGLGAHPQASFFLLGSGDQNNSGTLPASAWLRPAGDVDGDGLPDWIVAAPGQGPGGWGDDRTNGCPAFANPPNPPIVIIVDHDQEDLDFPYPTGGDGKFDVYEDFRPHNGILDPGEDVDGDGHLTPEGGCEGITREDKDCDHHLDSLNEDDNHNGILDPGEDRDGDGRLDDGTEDRNHNFNLDDRPDPSIHNDIIPDEEGRVGRFYPYGSARPSRGGITVITVAWNGTAYNLTTLNTPTTLLGPNEDLDHDGAFDVFEDFRPHNGVLDPGEDLDGDGRLTPPGGCEGVTREDKDCDGRLDTINEDDNHNGVLDPGEDRDGDGRLDDGTEDRNHNFILDDRPFPSLDDSYSDPVTHTLLPPYYPYETLTPRPYRLLAPTPLTSLFPRVDGTRLDPQGTLRLNISGSGVVLNDDAGGSRPLFDAVLLDFSEPGCCIVCQDCPPYLAPGVTPLPFFASNGLQTLRLPSARDLAFEAFTSIGTRTVGPTEVGPIRVRPQSAGSDSFLAASWPAIPLPNLLDDDFDLHFILAGGYPFPAYSPMDTCPHRHSPANFDTNEDGIGNYCDPADPGSQTDHIVPNRWIPVDLGSLPGPRAGGAAVFDAGRGVIVLFGGAADSDTWEFDVLWRRRVTDTAPEPRRGHRMIYDAARGRVVLFGGERFSDGAPLGDQWEFNGTTGAWTRIIQPVNPGPRSGFGMAYDASRQAIVLYGGRRGGTLLDDTWVYQGGSWRLVATPRSPGARADAAMTWDGFHRLSILVGGTSIGGNVRNDAWEFDGATWEPVDARGELPPTVMAAASFDAARRQVLIFGGFMQTHGSLVSGIGQFFETAAATRSFDGARFTPLPSLDTTTPRSVPASAFDAAGDRLFVQGGVAEGNVTLADTALFEQPADTDGDGVGDPDDDCPRVSNADQQDTDADGSGDACDDCPALANADQRDRDLDGLGDACDADRDGDGVANAADVCPDSVVPGRPDAAVLAGGGTDDDGDGIANDCDRCPADPLNDVDGDGVCGGADNCPAAPNPTQTDSNHDGAGDACQPSVRIVSIIPQTSPPQTLEAVVVLGDPDGERPSGRVTIEPATVIPEVVTAQLDPCASAFLPDGNAGEGLAYAVNPFSPPRLVDVDSQAGCNDGLIDYVLAFGTCAEVLPGAGDTTLVLDRPTPFPICVQRRGGGVGVHDYVVHRVDSGAVLISGALPPLLSVDYQKGKLPHQVALQGLPAPGPYVLRITAQDGTTPPVAAERLFDWNGERTLVFTLGGKKSLARPMIRIPHVY